MPQIQIAGTQGKRPMKWIAPSILSADFARLAEEVAAVEDAGADWLHVDVMDGHFVPNITIGPPVVAALKKVARIPLDVHLMIEKPERYIGDFAQAGADWITVQVETCTHLHRTVQAIREAKARPGVVLNPATPLESLDWIIEDVDLVMLMSVNPGFGGQAFIPATLEKIRRLKKIIAQRAPGVLIEVDGGVKTDNIATIAAAGADVFVAGSAIFGSADYRATIAAMRERIGG